MRQVTANLSYSPLSTEGRTFCLIPGMDLRYVNRRESDRIPFGVECAMPGLPAPSRPVLRPQPKRSVMKTVGYLLLTIVLLLCVWQFGRGLYIHFKAPVAQGASDRKA